MSTRDDITIRPDLSELTQPTPRQRAATERRSEAAASRGRGLLSRIGNRLARTRLARQAASRLRYLKHLRKLGIAYAAGKVLSDYFVDDTVIQQAKNALGERVGSLGNTARAHAHARQQILGREDLMIIVARGGVQQSIIDMKNRAAMRRFRVLEGESLIRGDRRFEVRNFTQQVADNFLEGWRAPVRRAPGGTR